MTDRGQAADPLFLETLGGDGERWSSIPCRLRRSHLRLTSQSFFRVTEKNGAGLTATSTTRVNARDFLPRPFRGPSRTLSVLASLSLNGSN